MIEGRDLPGRNFCDPDGSPLTDVHVGIQIRNSAEDLVPGDADFAEWQVEVKVIVDAPGGIEFRGPAVHGKRGDRFLYLTWGNVADGEFEMFRRAKLMLGQIDPLIVRTAHLEHRSLVGMIALSDACGAPRCGRVDSPDLKWQVR